jgi:uncharacterized membrane protein YgcG
MKKKLLSLLLVVLLLCALTVPALATDAWNTSIYRVKDYTGQITVDQIKALDDRICAVIPELEFDFVFCLIPDDMTNGQSLSDYGDTIYTSNDMGYGGEKSGILLVVDNDTGDYQVSTYGEGKTIFSDADLDSLTATLISAYQQDGIYSAFGAFFDEASHVVTLYRGAASDALIAPSPEGSDAPAASADDGYWNASLYRINDYCELLTNDEVNEFDTRICDVIDELRCDFVFCVITDDMRDESTLSEYNDIIYENNGMGYGSSKTGIS